MQSVGPVPTTFEIKDGTFPFVINVLVRGLLYAYPHCHQGFLIQAYLRKTP